MRCLPLLALFITGGQRQGVLHGTRLERAFQIVLEKTPHVLPSGGSVGACAHDLADHTIACCRCLRTLYTEEKQPNLRWQRRYPKTGALRRKLWLGMGRGA